MNTAKKLTIDNIKFSVKDASILLKISTQTISNREKSGKYPPPSRSSGNWRVYSLLDIFNLMYIEHGTVFIKPIVAILWDKGYTDIQITNSILTTAFQNFQGTLTNENTDMPEVEPEPVKAELNPKVEFNPIDAY